MAVKRKTRRDEQDLEKAACELLDVLERQGKLRHAHIPNGGARSPVEAAILNGMGVKRGFPDHIILLSREFFCQHVAFVEFKRPGAKPSDEQIAWGDWLRANGYQYALIDNIDDFLAFLRKLRVLP